MSQGRSGELAVNGEWQREPTGVAVVGCGYWGVNYIRVMSEMADAEVRAVCDAREPRLRDIARRNPGVDVTTEIDEVLERDDIEAIVIATTAQTHYDLTKRALLAGKHVLVEKPLTTNAAHANELVELSQACGRVLLVGHTFLYNAGVRTVKGYVQPDDVYYLYARRTNLGPIREDVNAIWDLAAHDIAIFNYLLDAEPTWVSAVGGRILHSTREDVGFISLGYPGEKLAHIHVSWADPNKVREVVVVSSESRIVFNDVDPLERVRVFNKGVKLQPADEPVGFGEYQLMLRDGDIMSPAVPASEPLKNQCGHFLHCVRRGEAVFTDAGIGLSVVRTLEAIDRSISQNGAPVTLDDVREEAELDVVHSVR